MRDEKDQDPKIGHATQGKAGADDEKHKNRNSSRTTSIITASITNHFTRNITITNKENQQARQRRQKPTRHQRTHATYGTSTDISGIRFIQEYEAGP
jgi:hypothetical protein